MTKPLCTHISCEATAYQIIIRRLKRAHADLLKAAKQTIAENGYLADGDNCTLAVLKKAVAIAEIEE